MEKIRARHKGKKNIYVHNDLSNAAHHFMEAITTKLEANENKGINFDYMACLMTLAFTFEARINFLGHKLIDGWKEKQPFDNKVSCVLNHLEVTPDHKMRPYYSIAMLKRFRDSMAHGKPFEIQFDEEVIISEEEINRRIDLEGEWSVYCDHDNVFNAYADVNTIWKDLMQAANLESFETITRGSSSLTFIEKIVDTE
jgi:hypothetical protein